MNTWFAPVALYGVFEPGATSKEVAGKSWKKIGSPDGLTVAGPLRFLGTGLSRVTLIL